MARKKSTDPVIGKSTTTKELKQIPSPIPGPSNTVNTITFSTDMDTLYLIDSGRAIPYSLNTIGGILVGVIKGQLVVVSAIEPMPDKTEDTQVLSFQERGNTAFQNIKMIDISTSKQHLNLSFIIKDRPLCVIGVTDIDLGIKPDDDTFNPINIRAFGLELTFNFLNIAKEGEIIKLSIIPNKVSIPNL